VARGSWQDCSELTLFLPINDLEECTAAQAVLGVLTERVGGFTRSAMEGDGRFVGRYKTGTNPAGFIDDHVLVVLVLLRSATSEAVNSHVAHLHELVHDEYAAQERAQEAVWIVAHSSRVFCEE